MATYGIYHNGQWYDEIYYDGHWVDQVYMGRELVWERGSTADINITATSFEGFNEMGYDEVINNGDGYIYLCKSPSGRVTPDKENNINLVNALTGEIYKYPCENYKGKTYISPTNDFLGYGQVAVSDYVEDSSSKEGGKYVTKIYRGAEFVGILPEPTFGKYEKGDPVMCFDGEHYISYDITYDSSIQGNSLLVYYRDLTGLKIVNKYDSIKKDGIMADVIFTRAYNGHFFIEAENAKSELVRYEILKDGSYKVLNIKFGVYALSFPYNMRAKDCICLFSGVYNIALDKFVKSPSIRCIAYSEKHKLYFGILEKDNWYYFVASVDGVSVKKERRIRFTTALPRLDDVISSGAYYKSGVGYKSETVSISDDEINKFIPTI